MLLVEGKAKPYLRLVDLCAAEAGCCWFRHGSRGGGFGWETEID